jgi:hypothetical protein
LNKLDSEKSSGNDEHSKRNTTKPTAAQRS